MDDLMSSLLVPTQDGQLIPASSASSHYSSQPSRSERVVCRRDEFAAPADFRLIKESPMSSMKDTSAEQSHAANSQKRQKTSISGGGYHEYVKSEYSPPCIPGADQTHLFGGTTARHSANTTSSRQHPNNYMNKYKDENLPPPSGQMANSVMAAMHGPVKEIGHAELMSMDEWDLQNPYTPPPPKAARPPRPTALPVNLESNDGSASHKFHQCCQLKEVVPKFDFEEVALSCWAVTLRIDGHVVAKSEQQYASKQDAKEAICERNLDFIMNLQGKKKRKSDDDGCAPEPQDINDEEWMGLVIFYIQSHKLSRPTVKATGMSSNAGPWYCELSLPGGPLMPFGHGMGPFRSKKVAEKNAAKETVQWLRSNGKLDRNYQFHNPNKGQRKPSTAIQPSAASPPTKGHTGLSQILPDALNVNATANNQEETAGMQVHNLAVALGFLTPTFQSEQREGAFVDAWAEFSTRDRRYEPRLAGQVGRIDHIFGKKAAKVEVWREVLRVLEQIKKDRAAVA